MILIKDSKAPTYWPTVMILFKATQVICHIHILIYVALFHVFNQFSSGLNGKYLVTIEILFHHAYLLKNNLKVQIFNSLNYRYCCKRYRQNSNINVGLEIICDNFVCDGTLFIGKIAKN